MTTTPIPDATLRQILGQHFLTVDDTGVDTAELSRLRRLKWTPRGDEPVIRSLEGLESATQLEELWLEGNDVRDLGPLAGLAHLRVLDIARNRRLTDIAPLRELESVRRLMLGRTAIDDLTPLTELPELRVVRLWGYEVFEDTDDWDTLLTLQERGVKLALEPGLESRLEARLAERAIDAAGHTDVDPIRARLRGWDLHELAAGWVADGPEWRDARGNTLFHRIVFADITVAQRVEMIERFARAGVDVDAINHRHLTALSNAVSELAAPDIVRALLDADADVNYPSERPPALHTFIRFREAGRRGFGRTYELLQLLLDYGARLTNPVVFRQLVYHGPLETIELALEQGADPDFGNIPSTPLMAAAEANRTQVVDLLLAAGADPKTIDVHGRNACYAAGTIALYDRFRAGGAVPNHPSEFFPNVLFGAIDRLNGATGPSEEELSIVRRLVEDGVSPGERGSRRRTVLHTLVKDQTAHGDHDVVAETIRALADLGAEPNALTVSGATPVDLARSEQDRRVLEELGGMSGEARVAELADLVVYDDTVNWGAAWKLAAAGSQDTLRPHHDRFAAVAAQRGGIPARLAQECGATSRSVIGWFASQAGELLQAGTLLHIIAEEAASARDELIVDLIAEGIDPEMLAPSGHSALRQYLVYGEDWSDVVLRRLTTSATIDEPRWSPPIVVAARKRHTWFYEGRDVTVVDSILDWLIAAGARLDTPRILAALCRSGRTDLVRRAVDAGADPHHVTEVHDTPLHAAVSGDHLEILEFLLDAGVDPDQGMFVHGRVPVHAVRSLEALELLAGRGASVDARARHAGESALFSVASRSDLDASEQLAIIERLEEFGQTVHDTNRHGRRASEFLESSEEPEVREFLRLRTPAEPESGR